MRDVFEYLHYREYLRDFYEEKKSGNYFYSTRFMADKLGMDHSLFVKILLGKRHLASGAIPRVAALCKLTGRQQQYFEAMVHFNKASGDSQARPFLDRMMALRGIGSESIEPRQYDYYRRWYYGAVRALLDTGDFGDDAGAIACRLNPPITPAEARRSLDLLSSLGFLRKDERGFWRVTDAHITTGAKWRSSAIKAYQKETIELSAASLDRDPPEMRDVSSLTLSIDRECFDDIREMLRQTRALIVKRVDEMGDRPRDRVYQVNMQLIPLSSPAAGRTEMHHV
jgi:uncharacterized protein (TIGR02147 family)